jgi:hypothetical protein
VFVSADQRSLELYWELPASVMERARQRFGAGRPVLELSFWKTAGSEVKRRQQRFGLTGEQGRLRTESNAADATVRAAIGWEVPDQSFHALAVGVLLAFEGSKPVVRWKPRPAPPSDAVVERALGAISTA